MLGDHKNEVLSNVIVTTDDEEVPLTGMSSRDSQINTIQNVFLTKLKSIARRIADMIEVNNSESVFEDPKFPHSSMIPENDDTLDNAVNNTENTSESIVDTIFKIQQTLKIYKVVRHLFLD